MGYGITWECGDINCPYWTECDHNPDNDCFMD